MNNVSSVYSEVKQRHGRLAAIGSASVVATDKILNKRVEPENNRTKLNNGKAKYPKYKNEYRDRKYGEKYDR